MDKDMVLKEVEKQCSNTESEIQKHKDIISGLENARDYVYELYDNIKGMES